MAVGVPHFAREEGRRLFGADPAAYDRARPGHAARVYEVLAERCGLRAGTAVVEVGPGTGQATRRLLELGAEPLVCVEPDPALAAYLRNAFGARIEIVPAALEAAELPVGAFDLAVAASSFHWVDEALGLARLLASLRPGGWVALWWTLFGDDDHDDAFIDATSPLLDGLASSPSAGEERRPQHGRDVEARFASLHAAGFEDLEHELAPWHAEWDTTGIRELYGSFSPIARLEAEPRKRILDGVAEIAERDFGGRVERRLLTTIYTARRPESN